MVMRLGPTRHDTFVSSNLVRPQHGSRALQRIGVVWQVDEEHARVRHGPSSPSLSSTAKASVLARMRLLDRRHVMGLTVSRVDGTYGTYDTGIIVQGGRCWSPVTPPRKSEPGCKPCSTVDDSCRTGPQTFTTHQPVQPVQTVWTVQTCRCSSRTAVAGLELRCPPSPTHEGVTHTTTAEEKSPSSSSDSYRSRTRENCQG